MFLKFEFCLRKTSEIVIIGVVSFVYSLIISFLLTFGVLSINFQCKYKEYLLNKQGRQNPLLSLGEVMMFYSSTEALRFGSTYCKVHGGFTPDY